MTYVLLTFACLSAMAFCLAFSVNSVIRGRRAEAVLFLMGAAAASLLAYESANRVKVEYQQTMDGIELQKLRR